MSKSRSWKYGKRSRATEVQKHSVRLAEIRDTITSLDPSDNQRAELLAEAGLLEGLVEITAANMYRSSNKRGQRAVIANKAAKVAASHLLEKPDEEIPFWEQEGSQENDTSYPPNYAEMAQNEAQQDKPVTEG